MTAPACSEAEFIALYRKLQSTDAVAKSLGISANATGARRRNIEKKHGIVLPVKDHRPAYNTVERDHPAICKLSLTDGQILIGSDAHIWPGERTTMQRAFIAFAKMLKPFAIVANGDFFDGASISRHPSIGWEHKPSVRQELEAVKDFMGDLVVASPASKRIWTLGNHDSRFESRIANHVPELAGVDGVHLKDHFVQWQPCWRVDVNEDPDRLIIRHRELGGEHADFRNVQQAGTHIATGHDHRAGVAMWRNYTGLKYGMRSGFMCDSATDPQFVHYLECKEPNWHPAFLVLTWADGRLLQPQVVLKHDDNRVDFGGKLYTV